MATPAYLDLYQWYPERLLPVAAGIRAMANSVLGQSQPSYNAVAGMDRAGEWTGFSRNAADDRADEVRRWLVTVSDNLHDVATSLEKGSEQITNEKSYVESLLGDARDAGYELSSYVDPAWPFRLVEGREEKSGDADNMRSWSERLIAQAGDVYLAVEATANSLKAELGQLPELTPGQFALNGAMGRRDAAMAEGGWTDEELAQVSRHLKDAQLTPDQLRGLMNGEYVEVPPGVLSYLNHLFHGMSPKETLALRYGLDGMNDGSGTAFANGIHTLSNERVTGGPISGGDGELPSWMHDIITERFGDERDGTSYFAKAFALGQLVAGATTPPGVKTGTALTLKVADMTMAAKDTASNPMSGYDWWMTDLGLQDSPWGSENGLKTFDGDTPGRATMRYEQTLESLLHAGTLNHQSSTAVLTGDGAMNVGLPGGYDRDATLRSLFEHEWRDDGVGVGHLTDWIDDYARDQQNLYQSRLSAAAFRGMFDFAGNPENFGALMDIDPRVSVGQERPAENALGDINPALARAMEEATRPYFNVLAGGSPINYGFSEAAAAHLRDLGGPDPSIVNDPELQNQVKRLFGIIASDESEGGAGAHLIRDIGTQQNVNAAHLAPSADGELPPGGPADIAARNGWMQRLLRDGVTAAYLDNWHDQNPGEEAMDAKDFNSLKSNVSTLVKEGLKEIPVVGRGVSVGAGMVIDWVQPPTAVAPDSGVPGAGTDPYESEVSVGTNPLLEHHYAAYKATNPAPPADPALRETFFGDDGRLRPLSEILSASNQDEQPGRTVSADDVSGHLRSLLEEQGVDVDTYDDYYGGASGAGPGASSGAIESEAAPMMTYDQYLLDLKGQR